MKSKILEDYEELEGQAMRLQDTPEWEDIADRLDALWYQLSDVELEYLNSRKISEEQSNSK